MVTPDDDDDVENHAERVKNEKLSLSLSLIGSDRIGSDPRSAVFLSRFSVLRRRLREIVVFLLSPSLVVAVGVPLSLTMRFFLVVLWSEFLALLLRSKRRFERSFFLFVGFCNDFEESPSSSSSSSSRFFFLAGFFF